MRRWEKAAHIETPQELHTAFRQMSEGGVELLVQERIEGDDARLYSLYTYFNRQSEPLATFVMQKRRQWPPMYGNGSFSVSCRQAEVEALGVKLLSHVGYRGVANLEFKQDPKDGEFKLIEVNVRCGNRIALAIASGVDIPTIMYRDILGEPVTPVHDFRTGVTWVDLIPDCASFLYKRRVDRSSLWTWVSSTVRSKSHSFFAYDDPMPFFVELCKAAKHGLGVLYRRLRGLSFSGFRNICLGMTVAENYNRLWLI